MARTPKPSGSKSTFGQPRDLSNSRKPTGSRSYQKRIVIVVEGTETENLYFEDMKKDFHIPTVKISIIDSDGKTAPFQIIERAIMTRENFKTRQEWEEDEDELWCVFDTEDGSNASGLLEAYSKADREEIKLAVSNPSFEYWYLLHYEETGREFLNADAVISRLRRFMKEYEKNKSVYSKIKRYLTVAALPHAQRLRSCNPSLWSEKGNPSTGVDILVEKIKKLSER
jgi:hypothetical protein